MSNSESESTQVIFEETKRLSEIDTICFYGDQTRKSKGLYIHV
jgi:hypothetical protein